MKAAVLVIVVQALLRIAGRALDTRLKQGLALSAFAALFLFDLPFPLMAGVLGAMLTTWVSFAPCFLWIFALAPWIDRLGCNLRLKGGLAALTAAVVGVIGNLTVWFALHVIFEEVNTRQLGPLRLLVPDLQTLDMRAIALVLLAGLLAFSFKLPVIRLLALSAMAGLGLALVA